jgi:tetratricopeptide (TPR) repeat protein
MDNAYSREQSFERFISILIALTTIFAAAAAFLEHISSNEAEKADRIAQTLSIQATTERINGEIQYSYDWQGAFQTWRELDLLITNAEQYDDQISADRFRQLRDRISALSPLLQDPYFDSEQEWPRAGQYEAELYIIEATRLSEQYQVQAKLSNDWENTANTFVLQLTFYAVALSLFGLSTTITNFTRWLFVGLGSLFVIINIGWGAGMLLISFDERPQEAINAYADGVGLSYQGLNEQAVAAFTRALESDPAYANALYDRGNAYGALNQHDRAAQDYEAAIQVGRNDTNVLWNLGWTYYLLGRFDDAVRINQLALGSDPSLIGVRMNQGLTLLAQGRIGNAITEYDLALEEAVAQVQEARGRGEEPPASLWFFLDAGVLDLISLLNELDGTQAYWEAAPPANLVSGEPGQIRTAAEGQIERIKEYTVSLEFFGASPRVQGPASASPFEFVQEIYDQEGNFVEYQDSLFNPYGTNEIGILFDFEGIEVGDHEVWKVYVNGYEDPALRVVSEWVVEEGSGAIKSITYAFSNVFIFTPGEYAVDFYINGRLVQRGTFWVEAP